MLALTPKIHYNTAMKQDYIITLRFKDDTKTFQTFKYADDLTSAAVSAKREVEEAYGKGESQVVLVKVEESNSVPLKD